jgi:dienelactone hydrolase
LSRSHLWCLRDVPTFDRQCPGSGHLFADPSSGDYNEEAAVLLKERTLAFLRRVGSTLPTGGE